MSAEVELIIEDPDGITLPAWIIESNLTLAEIGAVFCMACIKSNPGGEALKKRMGSKAMASALMALQKKGVLAVRQEGERVSCRLDLDRALISKGGAA
ncbi:MAG: hypothetical protein ACOYM3_15610 [Terrimicrobiaceae bacterium]